MTTTVFFKAVPARNVDLGEIGKHVGNIALNNTLTFGRCALFLNEKCGCKWQQLTSVEIENVRIPITHM
ncbi:hypothetical protein I312_105609 [Cryptococcus bacillisporus CA1280]|uniref:uncharacterized protein n=1 Tax=Cryptococcus bacillisporus CA1280 TaxID=1296109 RepID=UPI003367F785